MKERVYKLFPVVTFFAGIGVAGIAMLSMIGAQSVVVQQEEKIAAPLEIKKWRCHQVVTCEWADWRYAEPKDKCTYVETEEESPTDPANYPSYGAYCNEIL